MEDLLRINFTAFYGLPVCTKPDLVIKTDESYFEVEDTSAGEIVIYTNVGRGAARFSNPVSSSITIANYDKFLTSLPHNFQNARKRCDLVISDSEKCIILGELKDSPNVKHHRKKAKKQLLESLTTLLAVPQIYESFNNKVVKRCCYFNKQAKSPAFINASSAFNKLAAIFPDGFKMSHPGIEEYDFEFWEYLSGQTLALT
ncbi:MAG: hypothetical protein LAT67_15750 [Balneolales bacterium]|nr:hypothetical protein [Balneolales bacterium]